METTCRKKLLKATDQLELSFPEKSPTPCPLLCCAGQSRPCPILPDGTMVSNFRAGVKVWDLVPFIRKDRSGGGEVVAAGMETMENGRWSVSEARPGDAPLMAEFWRQLMGEEAPPLVTPGKTGEAQAAETFEKMLLHRKRYRAFLGAPVGGSATPAGFIFGSVYDRPYGEPRVAGHLLHWYVLPAFRGEGLGNRLYRSLMEWFESEGVEILEVMARKEPSRTRAWVDRGFVPVLDLFMRTPPWRP